MVKYYNAQATADVRVLRAADEIRETWGDTIDVGARSKSMFKFGSNPDVSTALETVWSLAGDETYVTANTIDKISSSSTADTEIIRVEGYTIAAGLLTFVSQDVTLVGQTETALTTDLARVTRAYNTGATALVGDVYIYVDDTVTAGVPQTAANIHAKIVIGDEQTQKCASSTAQDEYLLITNIHASVFKKTAATVADFHLEMREVAAASKVWRKKFSATAARGTPGSIITFDPLFIIPKNHDWRVRVIASATATECYATVSGILASVV